jgi:hypothetical protein
MKNETNLLDLHGIAHSDVRRLVIRFIEDQWDNSGNITIVTGHSKKMIRLATEVLDEYQLSYKLGDTFGYNNGCITVSLNE